MKSDAKTASEYIASLPDDRRATLAKMRAFVKKNLPKGYTETMGFGLITWVIPLSTYPDTYNGEPMCYVALSAQKNYNALYLMGCYASPAQRATLEAAFKKAGKKLDMGKSCLRFRRAEDLPLDAIGKLIASTTPADYIATFEKARAGMKKARAR